MDMANTIDNCSSNIVETPNIQEVVDKVDKLDIVDTQNSISAVILKTQTSSLSNLLIYDSESSDNEDREECDENLQPHVVPNSSSSDSESDSHDCLGSSEDDDKSVSVPSIHKKPQDEATNTILETIDLSNVQINYSKEQFQHIGHIKNFINALVTVEALTNVDSYNLDTLLFIDNESSKKILGAINDVIGPVYQPVYCVQLHDAKEIETLDLKEGMKVYSAPQSSYTKYVFLNDLIRMKGTDASWLGDEELPSDEIDSSDDESRSEQHTFRKRHHNNSFARHKQFENTENRSNTVKNQLTNTFDNLRTKQSVKDTPMFPYGFNPNIPPPNMQHNVHYPPR